MYNRALANCDSNATNELISWGVKAKIEGLKKDVIPAMHMTQHENCRVHMHDLEYYDVSYNCIGLDVEGLLGGRAKNMRDALSRLVREIANLTNLQSGGIGIINFDTDMAAYAKAGADEDIRYELNEFYKNLNINIRKGCERAYVTLNFGLDTSNEGRRISRLMLEAFFEGDDGMPFIFPNLVFKLRDGVNLSLGDANYDLLQLSAKVTAHCMIPTYFNTDASYNSPHPPEALGIVGCRTRLGANIHGTDGAIYRGNIAASTINLVQLALESHGSQDMFYSLLNETMNTAYEMLLQRYKTLLGNYGFEWVREKGLMVDFDKSIDTMARNNTLAIGFIGLWECVHALDITSSIEKAQKYGLEIISHMRGMTDAYTKKAGLNFSLLATSAEGISGKFPTHDKKTYGEIKGLTDRDYYTNSFHVQVGVDMGCFDKIAWEGPFHALCNGGCITYVELNECPVGNSESIVDLVTYAHAYDINYFGINFPLDICTCGAKGIFNDNCDCCGKDEITRLRRVSGYLSESRKFTKGKKAELKERKAHQ